MPSQTNSPIEIFREGSEYQRHANMMSNAKSKDYLCGCRENSHYFPVDVGKGARAYLIFTVLEEAMTKTIVIRHPRGDFNTVLKNQIHREHELEQYDSIISYLEGLYKQSSIGAKNSQQSSHVSFVLPPLG